MALAWIRVPGRRLLWRRRSLLVGRVLRRRPAVARPAVPLRGRRARSSPLSSRRRGPAVSLGRPRRRPLVVPRVERARLRRRPAVSALGPCLQVLSLVHVRRALSVAVARLRGPLARRRRGRAGHVVRRGISVTALHRVEVTRAHLGPERPGHLAVAQLAHKLPRAMRMAAVAMAVAATAILALLRQDVVLALLDRLGPQELVELVALRVFVRPPLDCLEHVFLDLDALVAKGRMVECPEDVVHNLIYGNVGVLPRKENAPGTVRR